MKNKKLIFIVGLISLLILPIRVFAINKEETVYVVINNDGSVKETYVSEYLMNKEKNNTIDDISDLSGIINVNGNETFIKDDYHLLWDASGNDIFYQGRTNKNIPIELKISYYLNGKEYKLDDILGKSGEVIIKIKYINNDKHVVKINGKKETLYTPFVVGTTSLLPN